MRLDAGAVAAGDLLDGICRRLARVRPVSTGVCAFAASVIARPRASAMSRMTRCVGGPVVADRVEAHHLIVVANGGQHDPALNLSALCGPCHRS